MNSVWEHHPATAREVLEDLEEETGWAYTTVKTMMDRLVDKGVLSVRMKSHTSHYEPVLSKSRARRFALSALADHAFGGTFAPLVEFLVRDERLTDRERREIARLLRKRDKR